MTAKLDATLAERVKKLYDQNRFDPAKPESTEEVVALFGISGKARIQEVDAIREESAEALAKLRAGRTKVGAAWKKRYGKKAGCGDEVFYAMLAALEDEGETLEAIAKANGEDLQVRWGHLNYGMQRMNLSNVLRARLREKLPTEIGATLLHSGDGAHSLSVATVARIKAAPELDYAPKFGWTRDTLETEDRIEAPKKPKAKRAS